MAELETDEHLLLERGSGDLLRPRARPSAAAQPTAAAAVARAESSRAGRPRGGARALRVGGYGRRPVEARCGDGCCGPTDLIETEADFEDFGAELYSEARARQLPDAAKLASLGCGNPTAVAELHEGETVLDLGSGGGIDVLLSARRVGPTGKAYGLDMTDEMLELARANQREAGVENVEFLKGTIEDVPLPDDSVDVVISNCVINLSADKPAVFREAARVLRPGGRFAVSDVVADPDMDEATRRDMAAMDWLHRRRLDVRGVPSAGCSRLASRRSRSPRRIACTSTPAPRSSVPASRRERRHRPSQRPPAALPRLGARPLGRPGHRPSPGPG